jgi:hypothetical protein
MGFGARSVGWTWEMRGMTDAFPVVHAYAHWSGLANNSEASRIPDSKMKQRVRMLKLWTTEL